MLPEKMILSLPSLEAFSSWQLQTSFFEHTHLRSSVRPGPVPPSLPPLPTSFLLLPLLSAFLPSVPPPCNKAFRSDSQEQSDN